GGFRLFNGYPGKKYGSLFALLSIPNKGVSIDSLEAGIYEEIEKIKKGQTSEEDLERARTKARANLIRGLDSNMGLARRLASAESQQGDWKKVFTNLEKLEEVTLDDLQRVAKKYLTTDNRTVVTIVTASDTKEASNAK